jgi:energy coupling factor transporter S component ThiW
MKSIYIRAKIVALVSVLSALGVIIAPIFWFPFFTTKAFPGQHMINAITGVLLGPIWAAVTALIIGIIRNSLGIGTIYAFPGGIPGGIIVGLFYALFKKLLRSKKKVMFAALTEPIGTILIGATLSLFLVAPWIGDVRLLSQLEKGPIIALIMLWGGWTLSSISGCIIGLIILLILDRMNINRETLFGRI